MKIEGFDLSSSSFISPEKVKGKKVFQDVFQSSAPTAKNADSSLGKLSKEDVENVKGKIAHVQKGELFHRISSDRVFNILSRSSHKLHSSVKDLFEEIKKDAIRENNYGAFKTSLRKERIAFFAGLITGDMEKQS